MKIYLITGNKGKAKEYNKILRDYGFIVKTKKLPINEIQADKLEDVAIYKAKEAYSILKKPLIVEDAGLFIESLSGFPGVYSAYVLKTLGNEGLLKLLKGEKNRKAYFKAVIGFIDEDKIKTFSGKVEGFISKKPKGEKGFGFDPIFIPVGRNKTFAEDFEYKNKVSHRRKAIDKFVKFLLRNYG